MSYKFIKTKIKNENIVDNILNIKWFHNCKEFFKEFNNIIIDDIFINKVSKDNLFNILDELYNYIKNNKFKLITNEITTNDYCCILINLLNKMLIYQNKNNKSNNKLNSRLRDLLDVNIQGQNIKNIFFEFIKQNQKIDNNSLLLLNPFTSIINLNEIYLQTDYYITFSANLNYLSKQYYIKSNDIQLFLPLNHKLVKLIIMSNTIKSNIIKSNIINVKKKLYDNFVNNYLKDVSIRLFLIQYLANNTILKPEPLTLYLINYNKKFMDISITDIKSNTSLLSDIVSNKIIYTSNEINTGVTNGIQIIITREEEALKTIIHECIHFYNLDFKSVPEFINKWIFNNFNIISISDNGINKNIYIFEAYTEFIASILHLLSKSISIMNYNIQIQQKKTNDNDNDIIKIFKNYYIKQVIYTFNKFCQILAFSKCQSFNQFIKINKLHDNEICTLNESTNVFCYYYLKLALYLNIKDILKLLDKNTAEFIKQDISFNKLLIIFKKFTTDKFIIDNMNKKINIIFKKIKNNKITDTSLKMIFID